MTTEDLFDLVWKGLAKQGACDSYLGMEYHRVKVEFFRSVYIRGCIMEFIMEAANRPVNSPNWAEVSRTREQLTRADEQKGEEENEHAKRIPSGHQRKGSDEGSSYAGCPRPEHR